MRIVLAFMMVIAISGYSLGSQSTLRERAEKARVEKEAAARDYKASLEKLLLFQEADVKTADEVVEKRKALFTQHVIEQRDIDEAKRALAAAREKVAQTKRQIAEADSLAGTSSQQIKAQSLPIRTPSSSDSQVIPLDPSDAKYIKDALSEMWGNALAVSIAQEKAEVVRQRSDAIFKAYCKCSDSEYRDWQSGQGLPSVIHRMDEAKLSLRNSALIADYRQEIGSLSEYVKKHNDLVESTARLVEKRVEMRFEEKRPEGASANDYQIDFENLGFVKLGADEKSIPIYDTLITYFGAYINRLTAQIRAATEKLQKENRHRNTAKKTNKRPGY
jgi:hypothetical protein